MKRWNSRGARLVTTAMRQLSLVLLLVFACGGDDSPSDGGVPLDAAGDASAPSLDAALDDGSTPDPLVVSVESGVLRGVPIDGSRAFLGVPYAAPPERWRPPTAPLAWEGVRDASAMSDMCTQPGGTFLGGERDESFGSEDCLYLNVWTSAEPMADLPVLVFLHGGGNYAGSTRDPLSTIVEIDSGEPFYDGARVAARGPAVVVTLKYRLGVLGYLSHPALDEENESGTSGNWGLMDQIAALEWVQRNIAAFGGDPQRVLLFGQSGGGRDTILLATSDLTQGLFHAVAPHSPPTGAEPRADARVKAGNLVSEMGCAEVEDVVGCMRDAEVVSAHRLVTADAAQPEGLAAAAFRPIVDGYVVRDQPTTLLATAQVRDFPWMMGTTDAEYSHRWAGEITAANYRTRVTLMVGAAFADAVLAEYPVDDYASAHEAFVTMMSDRNVSCGVRRFVRSLAGAGKPVYHYRFRDLVDDSVREGYGAYHTSDLLFLFQQMDGVHFPASDDNRATAAQMLRYWVRFAAAADPNGGDDPVWAPYELASEPYMGLAPRSEAGTHLKQVECDFWDSLYARP